jgi:YjbE family integral membrane protein
LASLTDGALTVAQIVFVNMILSGDNALIIAMTARRLPVPLRRRAVLWGSALAVLLQVAFAIVAGWLLAIPGLRLAGAVALVLITRRLIGGAPDESREPRTTNDVLGAVLSILIANLVMSFDNVLAVGALSRGQPALIALGILVSAVMLLAASSLVIALIERYRWVTLAGAGLLACTAAGMICEEPLLAEVAESRFETGTLRVDSIVPNLSADLAASDAERNAEPPRDLIAATTGVLVAPLTRTWTWTVYGVVFSACFGNLCWWSAIRHFDRDHESEGVEGEPACVRA